MKTDWRSLKGKTILIRWVVVRVLLFTSYRDSITKRIVEEVSPNGRVVLLVHPSSKDGEWSEINEFKLLDVL